MFSLANDIMLTRVGILKTARERVDAAAATVTATSEQIGRAIGVAIGLAVVALLCAAAAIVVSIRGRRPAAAAANG